jgi:hypothetical protein
MGPSRETRIKFQPEIEELAAEIGAITIRE